MDVPAKLSARARLLDTGHNRKTDAHDAHAVAMVAVRTPTLRVLAYDVQLEALRLLVDRRAELSRTAGRLRYPARPAHTRTPTLRISHFPDPHQRRYARAQPLGKRPLKTAG